ATRLEMRARYLKSCRRLSSKRRPTSRSASTILRASPRPSGHLQTEERLQQRDPGALDVEIDLRHMRRRRLRQALLGTLLRALGALDVNLLRALTDVRKNRHAIGQHFDEAKRDHQ